MIIESRQVIHAGVNFVLSPLPVLDSERRMAFQKALEDLGIVPHATQFPGQDLTIVSKAPTNLQLKVALIENAPLGQFLVIATQPGTLDLAKEQAELATKAFQVAWPEPQRQFLRCDVTLRVLYETSKEHAFLELWEVKLGQSERELQKLGRPVLGGGLRFVMPGQTPDQEMREVKIESFLSDTRKIFIETQFVWGNQGAVGNEFATARRFDDVDRYVKDTLVPFMTGGQK